MALTDKKYILLVSAILSFSFLYGMGNSVRNNIAFTNAEGIHVYKLNECAANVSLFINTIISSDTIPDAVIIDRGAEFPGGEKAWTRFISKVIQGKIGLFTDSDFGTCLVRFMVCQDGKISDVEALTMRGTQLAKIVVDAISSGPKWKPAEVDGKPVNAYRTQPVTLKFSRDY